MSVGEAGWRLGITRRDLAGPLAGDAEVLRDLSGSQRVHDGGHVSEAAPSPTTACAWFDLTSTTRIDPHECSG